MKTPKPALAVLTVQTVLAILRFDDLTCGAALAQVAQPVATNVLPAAVDLRPNFDRWNLPLRKQGHRGTCSVFATVSAIEYALASQSDRGLPLSVEFLNWAANRAIQRDQDGHFFSELMRGYERFGICPEADMPYGPHFNATNQPSPTALAAAREIRSHGVKFHWIRSNDGTQGLTDQHLGDIKRALAGGHPVAAGSYHSILLVGYTDTPGDPEAGRFIVRDSGGGNERTLAYAAAKKRMCDLFWVEPLR
jgi:C1A family cysteine protease